MKISFSAIKEGAKVISKFASKHSPTIYVAVGVGLMVGAVVKTIVEAPKAKEELDILENVENVPHSKYFQEKARIIASHYWPTTVMTLGGTAFIFWGHKVSLGRTAAALAAYQMSKDDLKRLEEKIKEVDGEKHLEKVKDEISRDRVMNTQFKDEDIIYTGKGNNLFVDSITGQPIRSSFEAIHRAENALNAEIHSDPELAASLNTWLDLIGARNSKVGDKIGWRFSKTGQNVEITFRCVDRPNEEVYHVLEYNVGPIWDFDIYESSDRHSGYGDW